MTTPAAVPARELPGSTTWSYAAGSLGTGAFATLPGLVLAYYLTDVLGVAASVASVVVFWPKVVDVLLYPLIGALSDRHSARSGHRRGLMYVAAATLPLLFLATFSVPPDLGVAGSGWWVVVFFTTASVSFSCFQVPYIALPAELTTRPPARIRLLGVRVAMLALAILLVGGGGPFLRDAFGGGRGGYAVMAAAVSVLMFVGILATTSVAARRTVTSAGLHDVPAFPFGYYAEGIRALRRTAAFRRLLIAFALQAGAAAVMLAGAQYVATHLLGAPDALTVLFAALIAPSILSMPLWVRLARRRGKNGAYTVSTWLFLVSALAMIPLALVPGWWIVGPVATAGVAYAGLQALPMSMLPDSIDIDATRTGVRRSGVLSGMWTATETAAMAMGPVAYLLVLSLGGFVSSTSGETALQPDTASTAIALGFSLLPAVLAGISVPVVRSLGRFEPEWEEAS